MERERELVGSEVGCFNGGITVKITMLSLSEEIPSSLSSFCIFMFPCTCCLQQVVNGRPTFDSSMVDFGIECKVREMA